MSLAKRLERLEAQIRTQDTERKVRRQDTERKVRRLIYDPREWEITEEEAIASM